MAIIGGGDVAIDAARTALRVGAERVTILYRRTEAEMPARDEEIEDALEEGVEIQFLTAPRAVVAENGKTVGITCFKMELGEPDDSGRRRPVPVENSDFTLDVSFVIPAIGQRTDTACLETSTGWNSTAGPTLKPMRSPLKPAVRAYLPEGMPRPVPPLPSMPWPQVKRRPCP